MSTGGRIGRSYKSISLLDLKMLGIIAKHDQKYFFQKYQKWAKY